MVIRDLKMKLGVLRLRKGTLGLGLRKKRRLIIIDKIDYQNNKIDC